MAVQAPQHLLTPPAFLPHHDIGHAFRALEDATVGVGGGGGGFFDELVFGGCAPAPLGDAQPRSELTCNGGGGGDSNVFLPRKRARVASAFLDDGSLQQQGLPLPHGQMFSGGDVQSRALGGCGAASTSGRVTAAAANGGVLSQLYHQGVEIDALVRLETERMRAGLQEARRRHARAVVAAVQRAAAGRLRQVESELERARRRNAELEERLRQVAFEREDWVCVARGHEAVAAGLRATLDQLLLQQQPGAGAGGGDCGGGEAEDAQSCCFETAPPSAGLGDDDAASRCRGSSAPSCKACGGGDACVLLLPCRHLCLCRACEPAAEVCPVCAAAKNASLQVLL